MIRKLIYACPWIGHPRLCRKRPHHEAVLARVTRGARMSQNGFKLGVVMLATNFPRPLGDIGNPQSHGHPVDFRVAPAATPSSVVCPHAIHADVVESFVIAAKALVEGGCQAITTSCGFACAIHDELQAELSVPLVTSSLNLVPEIAARYGRKVPLPVITYDSRVLSKEILKKTS